MSTSLVNLSIREAGECLARREVSAQELVEQTIQQIALTEPTIHAYTLVLAERAREAARRADSELAAGKRRGPLHGIPIAVKDLCFTAGIVTEAGSRALAGFVPTFDATVVEHLRRAGAIMIGKTVTHEFAYGVNEPATRSPWLEEGYPGGSSAGSGAAVAARSAFGALGTDTGGSIREPAALNGIVGLKPTYGLVSRAGIVPLSASLDHAGPLARTVDDCALLLQALAGYDARDSGSIATAPVDYASGIESSVRGMTIGIDRTFFMADGVQPEVLAALEGVIEEYAAHGVRIVEIAISELELMQTVGVTIMLSDASSYARRVLREHAADLDPATRVMFELGELLPATHYIQALRARTVLRNAVRAAYQDFGLDALVSPTVPSTTYPIGMARTVDESGEDPMSAALKYMIPANITGQPALTFPCGFSRSGLPIGCQLMGRPFQEHDLFRLARAYEQHHDWATVLPPLLVG